jgi:hypothetical protein
MVSVDAPASKEAVMHHALGKHENGDCQSDQKQDLSKFEPGRLFSRGNCLIRIGCHLISLPAE